MTQIAYEDRVAAQIAQYASTINMHDLPESFHIWSHDYIRPGLEKVFGTSSIDDAYALAFIEARRGVGDGGTILSVGCGDGGVEIRICEILLENGMSDFKIYGLDVSPILLGHFRVAVEAKGLGSYFDLVETDLNALDFEQRFDMVMANHSLHHILELERLFKYIRSHLTETGIFATCDMIGRNGHMRWPEAAAVIRALWPTLDVRQKYHVQLKRFEETFEDHDCSSEGFEGIRAQDILPLLLQEFHPYKFMGAGGFVDILVDRGYGHGFDVKNPDDVAVVRMISDLNEILLDAGVVKPTWTMAYFTIDDRGESFYRDRRAVTSIRAPAVDPAWTRFHR